MLPPEDGGNFWCDFTPVVYFWFVKFVVLKLLLRFISVNCTSLKVFENLLEKLTSSTSNLVHTCILTPSSSQYVNNICTYSYTFNQHKANKLEGCESLKDAVISSLHVSSFNLFMFLISSLLPFPDPTLNPSLFPSYLPEKLNRKYHLKCSGYWSS